MIKLRQSNKDLGIAEYEMLQGIENGENGFYETGYMNNGMKYTDGTYAKLILMQKDFK